MAGTHDGARALIERNTRAIAELEREVHRAEPRHRRALHALVGRLARPIFLLALIVAAGGWIAFNLLVQRSGQRPLDPPPFFWLQGAVSLSALVTSMLVLIGQAQQRRFDEHRANVELQVNLLAEQKTAKLIDLVEELRRDMPNVRDRDDAEARSMSRRADPAEVLAGTRASQRSG